MDLGSRGCWFDSNTDSDCNLLPHLLSFRVMMMMLYSAVTHAIAAASVRSVNVPWEIPIGPIEYVYKKTKYSKNPTPGFGTMSAWCDADFYPNGGGRQPGCPKPVSHALADVFTLKIHGKIQHVNHTVARALDQRPS